MWSHMSPFIVRVQQSKGVVRQHRSVNPVGMMQAMKIRTNLKTTTVNEGTDDPFTSIKPCSKIYRAIILFRTRMTCNQLKPPPPTLAYLVKPLSYQMIRPWVQHSPCVQLLVLFNSWFWVHETMRIGAFVIRGCIVRETSISAEIAEYYSLNKSGWEMEGKSYTTSVTKPCTPTPL